VSVPNEGDAMECAVDPRAVVVAESVDAVDNVVKIIAGDFT
jgi:hypothetical protein